MKLSIFTCASGFHSDGNGNWIDPAHTPITNTTYQTGYKDDGYGNFFYTSCSNYLCLWI